MRLGQLHRYLGELLALGVDEHMPVCIPVSDMPGVSEVDRVTEADGGYSEDASPGYAGFLKREGRVMVLTSGAAHLESLTGSHRLSAPVVALPAKNWPAGDWRKK
ncbi:TPA: hypothetical protein ACNVNE_001529 [Klebsiella aerogenes]